MGCAVVWKEGDLWRKKRVHLGRQKEAFDVEMYVMSEAMKIADEMAEEKDVTKVMVFTDSQATFVTVVLNPNNQYNIY